MYKILLLIIASLLFSNIYSQLEFYKYKQAKTFFGNNSGDTNQTKTGPGKKIQPRSNQIYSYQNTTDEITAPNMGVDLTTKLVYATADLIIQRAEAELTIKYLSQLKNDFDKPLTFTITLDPNNINVTFSLKEVLPHIYAYIGDPIQLVNSNVNIGKSFQTAFESDLTNLPDNLLTIINRTLTNPIQASDNLNNLKVIFTTLYPIFIDLIHGVHPSLILSKYASLIQPDSNNQIKSPLNKTIKLLNILSQGFLSGSGDDGYWINVKEYSKLETLEVDILCNKLYENHKADLNAIGINKYCDFIKIVKPIIPVAIDFFNHLDKQVGNINNNQSTTESNSGNKYSIKATNSKLITQFANYLNVFTGMIEQITKQLILNTNKPEITSPTSTLLFTVSKDISNIALNLSSKDYTMMLYNSLDLLNVLDPKASSKLSLYMKYVSLAAEISSVDSISQVKNILNGLIAPVTSYTVKRSNKLTIGLNSYVGVSSGYEFLDGSNQFSKSGSVQFAPTAMIGLDISWKSRDIFKCIQNNNPNPVRCSNGFFLSIFDIGSVVNYRISNTTNTTSTVNQLPKINFTQLLSPGLFWIHGLNNTPLSYYLGIQYTPGLRSITDNGVTTQSNAIRATLGFVVDIPFFTLSTSKLLN